MKKLQRKRKILAVVLVLVIVMAMVPVAAMSDEPRHDEDLVIYEYYYDAQYNYSTDEADEANEVDEVDEIDEIDEIEDDAVLDSLPDVETAETLEFEQDETALGATETHNGVLTISAAAIRRGRAVAIEITVASNPGFSNLDMRVAFPPELTLTNVIIGGQFAEGEVPPGDPLSATGYIDLAWSHTSNHTEDGLLATLIFNTAVTASAGRYYVTAAFNTETANSAGRAVTFDITDGYVWIRPGVPGAVSGGDSVGTLDLLLLAQYLSGHDVVLVDEYAARVSQNSIKTGHFGALELLMIAQYLSGYDVVLGE